MPDEIDDFEEQGAAGAESAVETPEPGVTEGSESSSEAVETKSPADIARDEFLKKYGDETETDAGKAKDADPDSKPEGTAETERQEGAEEEKVRLSKQEFDALPERARKRIGYLAAQNKQATSRFEALTRQVESEYRPAHEAITALKRYAADNGLSGDDINAGLGIMGQLQRRDFEGFIDKVKPFWEMAHRALGRAVSPEIQTLVDSGDMTQEAALRATQAEQRAALDRQALERTNQAVRAGQERQQVSMHANAMAKAASDTEIALRSSDPEYDQKKPAIEAGLALLLHDAKWKPANAAEVVAVIRKLHANAKISASQQNIRPTNPRPNASDPARKIAAPRSTLEALEQGFAQLS